MNYFMKHDIALKNRIFIFLVLKSSDGKNICPNDNPIQTHLVFMMCNEEPTSYKPYLFDFRLQSCAPTLLQTSC